MKAKKISISYSSRPLRVLRAHGVAKLQHKKLSEYFWSLNLKIKLAHPKA